jgi:hypothetical protein
VDWNTTESRDSLTLFTEVFQDCRGQEVPRMNPPVEQKGEAGDPP